MSEIERGSSEIIGLDYIKSLVERFFKTGQRFIVKAGFDPTAPDLHLGHSVLLSKLATLERYGGEIKFLIGDFTAMIGDPSGKSETRKILSREEVLKNAQTYKEQVGKILGSSKFEICFNSTWLSKLGSEGMLQLTSKFSVARMLERDDFAKRHKENLPISIVEFMYPLLQGYDSVAMECDIECGGNDQKFNLLVGRSMQRSYGLSKEQSVLMMPLLEGLDGVAKMSKSLGNYIGITDEPNEMYAKILSISDSMMWRYYELLSGISLKELKALREGVESAKIHPKKAKEDLALEIVAKYHDEKAAKKAKENFDAIFSKDLIPEDLEEFEGESNTWICKFLVDSGMAKSTSEARRDIKAGAFRIEGEKLFDENFKLKSGIYVMQIGKRKFVRAKIK
ncbi:tyrosine--tRNA ligase [Helicobacter sp. 16-1353]|uniref:tyrosine--tRNA ligase n=1 Tax=Helicobacter sp. 16-1353 TaxID=2004996 RepID=UPI000DCCBDB7|nr:tyrosine--tRNA ligase [Helicobacter sp. 16-1353]RAX52275.1 tyrosine--tRNA ligase [Helicobacter sp. 16-1353]